MGLFDQLFRDNKKDDNLEKEMDNYCLDEYQKNLVRKGEYDPWNFDDDDNLEEDDYHFDDDI